MFGSNINKCLNVDDLREAARRRAHKMVFDYIDGGADDEVTLARNVDAFNDYELMYKVLCGVDNPGHINNTIGAENRCALFSVPVRWQQVIPYPR